MARMSFNEAKAIIENGPLEVINQDKKWVARYRSNHHIAKTFENGYDVVHMGMYCEEREVAPIDACKSDEYQKWFGDRAAANKRIHTTYVDACRKARYELAQQLFSMDEKSRNELLLDIITEEV